MRTFNSRAIIVAWAVGLGLGLMPPHGPSCGAAETFQDSVTIEGSFPTLKLYDKYDTTRVWGIEAYSAALTILDVETGARPFSILTHTPTTTLQLKRDSVGEGNVGINGTPDDQAHLQITAPSTPVIRWKQTGANAQIWDVNANQFFWFVHDATAGTSPFFIRHSAPTDSIVVNSNGSVGLGISIPDANSRLDIRSSLTNGLLAKRADANPHYLRVENSASAFRCGVQGDGNTQFGALTPGKGLNLLAGGTGKVAINASGQISFGNPPPAITTDALLHQSGARLTSGGAWANASSRDLKQDVEPITRDEARDTVRALQPVGYRYKNELDERYVGFVAEDVPELVATKDRKSLAPMDIIAVLTKVVQDQDRDLSEARRMIAQQQELLVSLNKRLADLERKSERVE